MEGCEVKEWNDVANALSPTENSCYVSVMKLLINFVANHFNRRSVTWNLVAYFGVTNRNKGDKRFKRKLKVNELLDKEAENDRRPIAEIAASIDTTLSDEQKAYVETLWKKIRGGDRSPRCK